MQKQIDTLLIGQSILALFVPGLSARTLSGSGKTGNEAKSILRLLVCFLTSNSTCAKQLEFTLKQRDLKTVHMLQTCLIDKLLL